MFNFVGSLIVKSSASNVAGIFATIFGMTGSVVLNTILGVLGAIWNIIVKYVWIITKWVLGMIDAMQFAFTRLVGLDLENGTSISLGDYIKGMQNISVTGSNYYNYILKIFRACFGVAIILMIVFTIIAMVMQDYKLATNGYQKADNQKGGLVKKIFTNILAICLMPLIFYTIIVGTNSILTSFYRALGNFDDTSIAGNVLAASTYDANRYRSYANANKRIPITIRVYSMENTFGKTLDDETLKTEIQKSETQDKLKAIAGAFANDSFLPFEKSTTYNGSAWESYKNYSITYNNTVYDDMGDYFENFICTREQYYVMADFVDFCQKYNIKYYVKALSESDICWKYVENIIANPEIDEDGNALGDITLNVQYKNAEAVNSPSASASAAGGASDDSYTLKLTTKLDMTSPISDALKTASTLLGVDSNTSKFNAMERDDSGDFENLVSWATKKVLIKLSAGFDLTRPSTWNYSDQIIVYEYYRFQNDFGSTNNTLEDYTISKLKSEGAKLDALEMCYRNYNSNTQSYSEEKYIPCVKINDSYYRIKESTTDFDDYGQAYYNLDVKDSTINYFTNVNVSIKKTAATKILQLSNGFDINKKTSWTFTDQVLVYEYFKDLTLSNGLRRTNKFSDFKYSNSLTTEEKDKIRFNIYNITIGGTSSYYLYINGTYYECNSSGNLIGSSFLTNTSEAGQRTFNYKLSVADREKYGIGSLSNLSGTSSGWNEVDESNAYYQKYSEMNTKLSEKFSFYNTDTWTFRDYAIIYYYINYLSVDTTTTLDSLRFFGIKGDIGLCSDGKYYLKIKRVKTGGNIDYVYLNLEVFNKTSELKITTSISPDQFDKLGLGTTGVDFILSYNSEFESDKLIDLSTSGEVESKKFYLSENFDAYNSRTWSIGDYLMLYLISKGYINTDIGMIQSYGYSALVYKIGDKNYYRFGKESSEDAFFLNEEKITKLGYTVEKWFGTNMMSFLLTTRYNKLSASELVVRENDFAGGVASNPGAYLYDLISDFSDPNSLQYILGQDILKQSEITNDMSMLQYSYSNPEINVKDLSTWNYLDLIIYVKTGTVPTADKPFTSYLYKNGSISYLLVDDVYVNISTGRAACSSITTQIISKNKKSFTDKIKFNEYYRNNFDYSCKTITDGLTYKEQFIYYSSALTGTGTAQFTANVLMTDLDIILAYNGISKSSDGYFTFDAYTKDGDVYIKLSGNKYYGISSSSSALVYYKNNSLISRASKAFTTDGTYKSFDGAANYNQFDAMLYSVLGSTTSVEYTKYKFNHNNNYYISVNDSFIYYNSTLAGKKLGTLSLSDQAHMDYLYENYYEPNFVTIASPNIRTTYVSIRNFSAPDVYNISDFTTWTGIRIILSKLEVSLQDCTLLEDNNGNFYLKCPDGLTYISLTGLVSVSLTADASQNFTGATLIDIDSIKLTWKLYNTSVDGANIISNNPVALRDFNLISNSFVYASGNASVSGQIINPTSYRENIAKANSISDICDWTFLGLISAVVNPTDAKQVKKYYANGKYFYVFENANGTYIVPEIIDSYNITNTMTGLNKAFTYRNNGSVTANSPLDIIEKNNFIDVMYYFRANKIIDSNGELIEFYIAQKTDGSYVAIYNLKNANVATSGIKYVGFQTSNKTKVRIVDNITQAGIFTIKTKGINELGDWSMLDFVASYAYNTTYGTFIGSEIYVNNNKYYVKVDDNFVMLPCLNTDSLFTGLGDGKNGTINYESGTGIIDMLTYNYNNRGASGTDLLFKYSNFENQDGLANFVSSYLRKSTGGKLQRFEFSESFNVDDFTSWKYSDYVIYYAFTNGFYSGNTSIRFPFVYTPEFSENDGKYYNLTYLDIVLAELMGKNASGDYNYLINKKASYEYNLVSDSNKKYYIMVTGGVKIYYVPLSDRILLDFSKMRITPSELGEVLNLEGINTKIEEFKNDAGTYFVESITGVSFYQTEFSGSNFQTFVNAHGAPGYVYYLLKQNPETGSTEVSKVINFSFNSTGTTGSYFRYDKFYDYYDKSLAGYLVVDKSSSLDISVDTYAKVDADLSLKIVYDQIYPDIEFDNYYYFNLDADKLKKSGIMNVNASVQEGIKTGSTTLERVTLNLKLSTQFNPDGSYKSGFKIDNVDTWTMLDYIIIREYSREGVRHNKFKDMAFSELYEDYYITDVYVQDTNLYLYINGNFYNIAGFVKPESDGSTTYVNFAGEDGKSVLGEDGFIVNGISMKGLVTKGTESSYDFRALFETLQLSINPNYSGLKTFTRNKDNISFETSTNTVMFKYIDTEVADTNYRINVADFGRYSVKTLIKSVSWVEKLMNDMQVYYPDLNWGILIATDGWIDTLGEFTSAYTNGLFVGGDNSANTTAAGLVLSEFFMSVAKEVSDSYANYEYSSIFEEDTIKALMLSLMGEENYNALVLEAEVFMDYFNSCFAPIIDDFATEFGEDIGSNSLRLCAYKSYLATLLLSSDIGVYLYTIATRVYAEYTIGEYLASAVGDYSGYYSYTNNLKDEEGNTVDSYRYGTFSELVQYENEYCGSSTPTFTFNYKKAFERYEDSSTHRIAGFTYEQSCSNNVYYSAVVKQIIKEMDVEYKEVYSQGFMISELGSVVDQNGNPVSAYSSDEYVFCYMIHVYWSIKTSLTSSLYTPIYLQNYKDYIDGNLTRWNIIRDENIETADQYYEDYSSDKMKLSLYKKLTFANTVRLYLPGVALADNDNEGVLGKIKDLLKKIGNLVTFKQSVVEIAATTDILPMLNAYDMFADNSDASKALDTILYNSLSIYFRMSFSEDSGFKIAEIFKDIIDQVLPADLSTETSWKVVNEFSNALDIIVSELKELRNIMPGETTESGSDRSIGITSYYYTDAQIDSITNVFQDLQYNVTQYIAAQTRIDQMQKRSITFTLAQFGANYTSGGYQFSVRNKDYTFKSNIDPSRLAEYVYGGAFLEKVGVGAQYTTAEFEGIIKATKVYDNVDKVLKTNLDSWSELRGFVSNLADKTAELYFTSNLSDLDVGTVNAIKINKSLNCSDATESANKISDSTLKISTPSNIEDMLYNFMASHISEDIVKRLIEGANTNHKKFVALARYIFSNEVTETQLENITFEDFKRIALQKLIDNEQNEEETPEERANRYMTLFDLMGVQIDFSDENGKSAGRIISYSNKDKNYSAKMSSSYNTLELIKTLSGLENRPTREILTRQYSGTRTADYFDEALGDSFIVCTYKDGLYYPVIGSGSRNYHSDRYDDYNADEILNHKFITDYYDNGAYVVVAKGIVTANGYPTAIRKYNNPIEISKNKLLKTTTETFNAVTYYRTDVGGNFGSGDKLVDASKAVTRVTTKNYTTYVRGTSFTKGIGSSTTYTGKTNLRTFVSSDYSGYFVQSNAEYLIGQADDFGGISVLEDFNYFYLFGGMTWVLLMLAFITVIPVMINTVGGAITRLFDLIVLFIASPLVISTNSLYPDGKNKVYQKWKKNVQSVLLGVFGYIIGFSSFSILVPVIYNIKSFVSYETFARITAIGGIGQFFSYPTVNSIVRALWIITAVTVLERIPNMLLPIITANRGDISTPDPGLGGAGKKFTDKANFVKNTVEQTLNKAGSVLSGRAALGLLNEVKDEALGMVPGLGVAKLAKDKIINPITGKIKNDKMDAEAKEISDLVASYTGKAELGKMAGKAIKDAAKAKETRKKDREKQMDNYKKEFKKNFM